MMEEDHQPPHNPDKEVPQIHLYLVQVQNVTCFPVLGMMKDCGSDFSPSSVCVILQFASKYKE